MSISRKNRALGSSEAGNFTYNRALIGNTVNSTYTSLSYSGSSCDAPGIYLIKGIKWKILENKPSTLFTSTFGNTKIFREVQRSEIVHTSIIILPQHTRYMSWKSECNTYIMNQRCSHSSCL